MAYTMAEFKAKLAADPETAAAFERLPLAEQEKALAGYNGQADVDVSAPPAAGIIPTALAGKGLYDMFASSGGGATSSLVETPNIISASRVPSAPVEAGIGTYAPGVIGAASLADLFANHRTGARGVAQGGLGGGGLGYTAAELIAPGSGLVGAAIGGGLGAIAGGLQKKSTKEIQADRWSATGKTDPNPGRDYFAGTGGEQSRDEKFLTPDAIRNNPDNYNNIPNWDSWSKEKQDKFLSTMLAEGKVTERKGGIYYDDARAAQLAAEIGAQPDTAPATSGPRRDTRRREKEESPFKTPYQPGVTLQDLLPKVDIPTPVGDPGNAIPSYTPKTFSELYDEQVKKRRGTYGQI